MKNGHFDRGLAVFAQCMSREPGNLQVQYLLGVCAFHLELYQEVIKQFESLLAKEPQYRKNAYLFLAIAQKKSQLLEEALQLTRALNYYPKYYDAIVLRAKVLSKLKRFYDAIEDLNRCLKLQPKNTQAMIAKADCLRALGQHSEAIWIYGEILSLGWDPQVLLKRGIGRIQSGETQEALKDLNKILAKNPGNSEAYLFKGMAYTKLKNYNQAILSYQQAIKFNSSRKATTKALYEVSKLKIQMGDFYGASYTLQRATSLEVDLKVIEKLRIFTQGATFIMKKKFKKGIENLNILSKKQHLNQQIKPLLYSFRAYAHFCQLKFLNALNDLANMVRLGYPLDSASHYNYLILQGITQSQNNNFKEAHEAFRNAQQARRQFSDPLIYMSLAKVAEYNRNPKTKVPQLLQDALGFIGKALERQQNSNSFYICAAILYALGNYQQCLENVQKGIEKAEQHVIRHFYLRGLGKAMLQRYKQAFVDFNNVLSLGKQLKEKSETGEEGVQREKQILEVYLNRAKCHLHFGQKKKAFQDLQTYISYKPLDSQIHTVAGRLLFSIGACEDAVKAYNYSPNLDKKKDELLERAKCYLLLKQLNFCLRDLEKVIELGDSLARFDYCCLSALKEASKGGRDSYKEALRKLVTAEGFSLQKGHVFQQADLFFYKGVFNFYLAQYPDALKLFIKAKNIKTITGDLDLVQESEREGFSPEQFQNRTFNNLEIEYDIALCQLLLGNLEPAKKVLSRYDSFSLIFGVPGPLQEPLDLTPFPVTNRLCSIFPQVEYSQMIRFKLSFCLPAVSSPEIKFEMEPRIIEQLSMASTEARPDAPWIKRNTFGVVFTDEMVGVDIDIQTENSVKRLDEIRIEGQGEEEIGEKHNRERLKDMFALDADVENKLAKLIGKNKKQ